MASARPAVDTCSALENIATFRTCEAKKKQVSVFLCLECDTKDVQSTSLVDSNSYTSSSGSITTTDVAVGPSTATIRHLPSYLAKCKGFLQVCLDAVRRSYRHRC